MATYRKPLKDIDGNFIIPAMTGDQTGWVQNGDLADGAVTADKIDFTTMESVSGLTRRCDFGSLHIFTTLTSTPTIGQTTVDAEIPADFLAESGRIVFASCVPYHNYSSTNQSYSVWWENGHVYAGVDNQNGTNEYRFCVIAFF